MTNGHVIPWDPEGLHVKGTLDWSPGQVEWTRYVLAHRYKVLNEIEIFGGVALALFRYSWHPTILKAMATNWDYVHNVFHLEDRDATLDLRQISWLLGVPVGGLFYEERVPPDFELYGTRSCGTPYHSDSLRAVFKIYYEVATKRGLEGKGRDVPLEDWVRHFMDRVQKDDASFFADPLDPSGAGLDTVRIPEGGPKFSELSTLILDDETILTAFLAWWLCYFVNIYEPAGFIRPGTFVVANALARGFGISLAIPALVNVYRSMRELTSSKDPSRAPVVMPLHILHGWFGAHWEGYYPSSTSRNSRVTLPALSVIAGYSVCPPSQIEAHLCFSHSRTRISSYRPAVLSKGWPPASSDLYRVTDPIPEDGKEPSLCSSRRKRERGYFISVREGYLTMRMGSRVIGEKFNPHRCAWQFGYDQDIPSITIPDVALEPTLCSIAD